MAYGSHNSKLIAALADKDHAGEVQLNAEQRLRLAMWIDANAPYHDRFVNKRAEKTGYNLPADPGAAERPDGDPRTSLRRVPPAGRGHADRTGSTSAGQSRACS